MDQKHCIQSVLRFLPLKTTFALAPVSKAWASVVDSPCFHPDRFVLDIFPDCETMLQTELSPHFDIAEISDIPTSALPKIGKLVSMIKTYFHDDDNKLITLSSTLFPNVTSLYCPGPGSGDLNAAFYKAIARQIDGIDTMKWPLQEIFDKESSLRSNG